MLIREAILADSNGLARVHVDTWHTTYNGIVPDEALSGMSYGWSEQRWREMLQDPETASKTYVAEDDDGVVIGFILVGPSKEVVRDFEGEVYAIYISEKHQRKGCGRMLMSVAIQHLVKEGFTSVMLWVLRDNPACTFYERLGGVQIAERAIEIGGTPLPAVAYGWRIPEEVRT